MLVIEKIVYSKIPPNNPRVIWVDVSDENKIIIKGYLNGNWIALSNEIREIQELAKALEELDSKIENELSNKVDKIDGKGLSANDFSDFYKEKLDNIRNNEQADWNESDPSKSSYINNKPSALPANGGNSETVGGKHYYDFATSEQGSKADSAIQTIQINGTGITKENNIVNLPKYPVIPESLKNPFALKVGNKIYDGSSEIIITTADLKLGNAIRLLGASSTPITIGGSEYPTINGEIVQPSYGDVVLYDHCELIWIAGDTWEMFGDEGSYAKKTRQIIVGTGLTGGGTLENDITIGLSAETSDDIAKGVHIHSLFSNDLLPYSNLSGTPTIPTKESWNYDDRYLNKNEVSIISSEDIQAILRS